MRAPPRRGLVPAEVRAALAGGAPELDEPLPRAASQASRSTGSASSLCSSSSSLGSQKVLKLFSVTTSAPLTWRMRAAAPKWSGWEWVMTTVCTRFTGRPAWSMRLLNWRHGANPGRPGSTSVTPWRSSMA